MKVAVTDYTFDSLDVERAILEPMGCQVVGPYAKDDPESLLTLVADADCVITQFAPIDARVIGSMGRARAIVRYGIGVDNVDLDAARARGIPVCNVPDYCIDEVADHTLGLILALTRQFIPHREKLRGGRWGSGAPLHAMHALKSLTIGIVGFGRIGRSVADRLRAFRCMTIVADPMVPHDEIERTGCLPVTLDQLLGTADVITLHCPSMPADARDDQSSGPGEDEARGALHQRGSRRPGRLRSPDRRPPVRAGSAAPGWTSSTPSRSRRTAQSWRWTTSSSRPTSPPRACPPSRSSGPVPPRPRPRPCGVSRCRTWSTGSDSSCRATRSVRPRTESRSNVIRDDATRSRGSVSCGHDLPKHSASTRLTKVGVAEEDARTTADVLVTTDTWGVFTHGAKRLGDYIRRIRAGGIRADARPQDRGGRPRLGDRRRRLRPGHGDLDIRDADGDREGACVRDRIRGRLQ